MHDCYMCFTINITCMYMYIYIYGTKQYMCDGQLKATFQLYELQLVCTPSKMHPTDNFPHAHRSIITLHPIKHRMKYNYHTDVE